MLKIIHKMGKKAIHVLLSTTLSSGPYYSSDSLESGRLALIQKLICISITFNVKVTILRNHLLMHITFENGIKL